MNNRNILLIVGVLHLLALTSAGADEPNRDVDANKGAAQSPPPSQFFRRQYHKPDLSFCNAQGCVDFDGDGRCELLLASRRTKELQMLNGSDGSVVWSRKLAGDSQSLSVYDLDGDGDFEILYAVSGPGRLYVLDHAGKVLRQWDSGDWKLGNSAVIVDADDLNVRINRCTRLRFTVSSNSGLS